MIEKFKLTRALGATIVVILVLGSIAIIYGMQWGPWTGSDSVAYIESSRNLTNGQGLVQRQASGDLVPLSLHPPLYPIALTLLSIISADILLSAKILNVFLFGLFILSTGFLFYLNKPTYSILLCILIVTSPILLNIFTSAMSEPLFFVTSVMSLILVVYYLQTNNQHFLILSVLLGSLALLTRYVGVAVIFAGSLCILIFPNESFLKRIFKATAYTATGFFPFAIWVMNLKNIGESLMLREFNIGEFWTRLSPFRIKFVDIVWDWLKMETFFSAQDYDFKLHVLLVLAIFVSLVIGLALFTNKRRINLPKALMLKSVQFAFVFFSFSIFFIIFTAIAFLISTQIDVVPNERILSPLLMGFLFGGSSIVIFLQDHIPKNLVLRMFLPMLILPFSISQIGPSYSYLQDLHENGSGYTTKEWHSSELIREVQRLPQDTSVISNEAEAILLHANRSSNRIPELVQGIPHDVYESFGQDSSDAIQQTFRTKGAALVLFGSVYWQLNSFYYQQTDIRLEAFTRDLYLYSQVDDGEIYFYKMP